SSIAPLSARVPVIAPSYPMNVADAWQRPGKESDPAFSSAVEKMGNAPRHKKLAQRRISSLRPWVGYNAPAHDRPRIKRIRGCQSEHPSVGRRWLQEQPNKEQKPEEVMKTEAQRIARRRSMRAAGDPVRLVAAAAAVLLMSVADGTPARADM